MTRILALFLLTLALAACQFNQSPEPQSYMHDETPSPESPSVQDQQPPVEQEARKAEEAPRTVLVRVHNSGSVEYAYVNQSRENFQGPNSFSPENLNWQSQNSGQVLSQPTELSRNQVVNGQFYFIQDPSRIPQNGENERLNPPIPEHRQVAYYNYPYFYPYYYYGNYNYYYWYYPTYGYYYWYWPRYNYQQYYGYYYWPSFYSYYNWWWYRPYAYYSWNPYTYYIYYRWW